MKFISASALFMMLAVPGIAEAYDLNDQELDVVRKGFSGEPIFHNVTGSERPTGNVLVCGTVNAKNSYGQYMGDSPFFGSMLGKGANAGTFILIKVGINPSDANTVSLICDHPEMAD